MKGESVGEIRHRRKQRSVGNRAESNSLYGVNISDVRTVRGGVKGDVILHLPRSHKDFEELDKLRSLGKFDDVRARSGELDSYDDGAHIIVVHDSIDGIMSSLFEMVTKLYEGHDVIVSFGALRPRHAPVANIGRSSGAASWMTLFALVVALLRQETIDAVDFAELPSFTTNLVEQGGSRRGALMLVMDVDSPVIEKFVTRKREFGKLGGANVSVAITDDFMASVKFWNACADDHADYEPLAKATEEAKKANRIWSLIIESAHASAEPGVLFVDTINNESNSAYIEKMDATNPCGEQPLPPHGSCNLGHLVLPRFVKGDWTKNASKTDVEWDDGYYFDWSALERAVRLGVRFQDDMIDYSLYPTPATKERQQRERRVGMGTMGLGTLSIMLGLRYGSDEHLAFCDELYKRIAYWAYDESMNIAAEKGAFPAFDHDKYVQSGFMRRLLAEFPQLGGKLRKHGIRNVTLLTQAPTGSTGTMLNGLLPTGCSTGIEPYFAWGYERAGRLGVEWISEPIVEAWREAQNVAKGDEADLPDYFVTAQDLAPDDHVRVQAAIQRWVDSAISKTANAPESFTVDDTARLYEMAYDLGCKGVTIYRANSRVAQVLSTERGGAKIEAHIEAEAMRTAKLWIDEVTAEDVEAASPYIDRMVNEFTKRPSRVYGFTEKIRVPIGNSRLGKVYVTIGLDEASRPYEVFVNANDEEIVDIAQSLGRMVTQMLRYGGTSDNVEQAIKHLRRGNSNMFSLPSQLARLLEEVTYKGVEFPHECECDEPAPEAEYEVIEPYGRRIPRSLAKCPECGAYEYDKAGCVCRACGTSRCG